MSEPIEIEDDNIIPIRNPLFRPKLVAEQLNTALAADTLVFVALAADAQEFAQASEPLPVLSESDDAEIMPALPEDWNGNGFIFQEPVAGETLHGTPEGDIFIVDGVDGVTARGYDGGDIFLFANANGTISAGAGGDVVDLTNFSGAVNLGAEADGDILLIWGAESGQLTRVYNFHIGEDAFVNFVDGAIGADTAAGWTLSNDGGAFVTFVGVHDDILA